MSLPSKGQLEGLTSAYRGQPFCFDTTRNQDTSTMTFAYRGLPFAYAPPFDASRMMLFFPT